MSLRSVGFGASGGIQILSAWELFSSFLTLVSRCWPSTVCMSSVSRLWKTARTGSRSSCLQPRNQNHSEYSWSDARYVVCLGDILVESLVGSCFFWAVFTLYLHLFLYDLSFTWALLYFPLMHLFVTAMFCKYFCFTCFFNLLFKVFESNF